MVGMTQHMVVTKIDIATRQKGKKEDVVAKEMPLHIFLGTIHFVSILCSPALFNELVMGHLLSEGLVESIDEISDVHFDQENRCFVKLLEREVEKRVILSKPFAQLIVSACGRIGHRSLSELLKSINLRTLPTWQIEATKVSECVKRLNMLSDVYRRTGGVHVGALFGRTGELIVLAEDVGRHNAVDKVIGAASLKGTNLGECFLALSGRLTGDIVLKTARVGVPIIASLAAAVDSGVEVARKVKATLVGFVRGNRMNIYSNPERIRL